jgi:hypothetical protein
VPAGFTRGLLHDSRTPAARLEVPTDVLDTLRMGCIQHPSSFCYSSREYNKSCWSWRLFLKKEYHLYNNILLCIHKIILAGNITYYIQLVEYMGEEENMTDDTEYLANYIPETLYVNPQQNGKGAYISLLAENEEFLDEIIVSGRSRLALSVFYVNEKLDFNTFKLTKIKYHKKYGWRPDGEIVLNGFQLFHLKEFTELLSSIDFRDATKAKISVKDLDFASLKTVLKTVEGTDLLKKIANDPALSEDIFALAHKKAALEEFRLLLTEFEKFKTEYKNRYNLSAITEEYIWQHFFEQNPWIFGHGLNYVFLDKAGKKLESITTGNSHDTGGKRVDALMRTRAKISQYVLIEIKIPSASLLKPQEYRKGCWSVTSELSDAVTQIQKTAFDFTNNQYHKVQVKDHEGRITGEDIFRIQPKCYLVIGNLAELKGFDDKFACFHLYRTSLNSPEILTYDELYERAKCIVETISNPTNPYSHV